MVRPILGLLACSAIALAGTATPARAAVELITNGGFEMTSSPAASELGLNGYSVTGWTNNNNGYNFIFTAAASGTAGTTSASQYNGPQGTATVGLYTPATSTATTKAGSLVSPVGGNVIAADGAFQRGSISQVVGRLSAGTNYLLTFWWAASQQTGFTGDTTESWGVTFGNQSYSTPTVTTPSNGFSPWRQASVVFSATSASQTLAFLAAGGPSGGQPPFSLLDGVSLVAAPEPATWAVLAIGLVGAGAFTARRRRTAGAAA